MTSSRPTLLRLCGALLAAIAPLASFLAETPAARAQSDTVTWNRKAYGQLHYVPGHEGDPAYSFHYSNNNDWSQVDRYQTDANGARLYQTDVSNWDTPNYPDGHVNVVLGADGPGTKNGSTNLDRGVGSGINIDSLTITPVGALNIEAGVANVTVKEISFQGDGALTNQGGGGAYPILTVPGGGMISKTGGAGTYGMDGTLVLNVTGATIGCESGLFQLSGGSGTLQSAVFDPAAGATIDIVGYLNGTSAAGGYEYCLGTLTNAASAGGTVRLSDNTILGNPNGTGGATILKFTGNVFQWTGGNLGGYQQSNLFTNRGVVNLSGGNTKFLFANLTNQGTTTQTASGALNIGDANSGGSFTNAAGGVYDLRSDAGMGGSGYAFNNAGLFKKSGGTGTSTLAVQFNHQGGTVQVDSGTLQIGDVTGAASTGGVFNVTAANAVFDLGSGGNMVGTYKGTGPGVVRFSHGALFGTSQAPGTTFNITGGGFLWTGGYFGGYQGSQLLTNAGKMTLAGSDGEITYALFTNKGTITHTGTGDFAISTDNGGGSFDNAAGAVYDLQSNAGLSGMRPLRNEGLFEKTAGTSTSSIQTDNWINTGTVAVRKGTLAFPNLAADTALNTAGAWQVFAGAGLTFSPGSSVTVNKADVTLAGANSNFPAINALADNQGRFSLQTRRAFTTAGAFSSGGRLDLGSGSTLHVSGALTLAGTSASTFRIGGASHAGPHGAGVLQVNGAAALAGKLLLQVTPDVILPKATDTITILSATSPLTGSFANAANDARVNAGSGVSFQVHYGASSPYGAGSVVLDHVTAPAPTITSFTPASGDVGAAVVITGTNFLAPLSVAFAGKAATVTSFTSTKITTSVPAGASSGPIKVTTNAGSAVSSSSFTFTGVVTPVITSAAAASGKAGTPFSYQITASNNPTSYGVLGLTPGLKVDGKTGLISGTPTASVTKSLTLKATNAAGTGQATLTLTISK